MRARWSVIYGVVAGGIGYAASMLLGDLQRILDSGLGGRELVAAKWLLILVFIMLGALMGFIEDLKGE